MRVKLVYKVDGSLHTLYFSNYHDLNMKIVDLFMCNKDIRVYLERSA